MTVDQIILMSLMAIAISLLAIGWRTPRAIFGLCLFALMITQIVSVEMLKHAITNDGLLILFCLLIASNALERSRVMAGVTYIIFRRGKDAKNGKLLSKLKLFGGAAALSSWLSNTAVVASLLGSVQANKLIAPSKLLMPLSYASIAAGTTTLIGTSTNLIVNAQLIELGYTGLGFFDFLTIGSVAFIAVFFVALMLSKWLPDLARRGEQQEYYLVEAKVVSSDLSSKTIEDVGFRALDHFYLVEILRGDRKISPVTPNTILQLGDKLSFVGDVRYISSLSELKGIELFAQKEGMELSELTQVLIKPGSAIVGSTIKESGFRSRFDSAIVGIKRHGQYLSGKLGDTQLQMGDMLTLVTGPDFKKRKNIARNFTLLNNIEVATKLTKLQEVVTSLGLLLAVVSSVCLGVTLLTTMAIYLGALFLVGAVQMNEIRHKLQVDILVIVISALCIASAFVSTGWSFIVAVSAQELLTGVSPVAAVIAVYLISLITTEFITNNAAAALMLPVAIAIANGLNAELMPFVMAVAFGASASFINPFGYQTNLIAFNSGGYSIRHFVACGVPVSLVYSVAVLSMIIITVPM